MMRRFEVNGKDIAHPDYNIQYHVIYCIDKDRVLVQVIDATAHDYRKK